MDRKAHIYMHKKTHAMCRYTQIIYNVCIFMAGWVSGRGRGGAGGGGGVGVECVLDVRVRAPGRAPDQPVGPAGPERGRFRAILGKLAAAAAQVSAGGRLRGAGVAGTAPAPGAAGGR